MSKANSAFFNRSLEQSDPEIFDSIRKELGQNEASAGAWRV